VHPTILVFAKYPEPGRVNTRLVPPLSHAQAAALHRASLDTTCELARSIDGARAVLVVTPDDRASDLAGEVAPAVDAHWAQGPGTLGARLARATARAFDEGATAVVLLGADSPTLPRRYLHEALAALEDHPVAMGPSDDGGYYLLALALNVPELFDGVHWGTGRVADQTRRRAQEVGVRLHEIANWHDIDRPEDIRRAVAAPADADDARPRRDALRRHLEDLLDRLQSDGIEV
jgi:rSAM/selenodomain-associated transferase 1